MTASWSTRSIEALTKRHALGPEATERLQALLDLVVAAPHAPTAVRDPAGVVNDHLADSLAALELPQTLAALTVADLGAGAGFPGLPLAIARPEAAFMLLESNARKCRFIDLAATACGLRNARAVNTRAESWPEGRDSFDLVTARAVASLDVVAEYAAPLLKVGGSLLAWRGRRDPEAEAAASRAAAVLGLEVHEPRAVAPYPGAEHRYLHLMSKVRDTPERYPRRPGVALKRPLGGPPGPSDRCRR